MRAFARVPFACAVVACALAACGPDPDMPLVADSHEVVEGHPQEGALWPILFQHCARTRSCDPMTHFSEGAGQASGYAGSATWFAETADAVPLDGARFGPRVILSFSVVSDQGGPGGRPLTRQETPANLRAPIARQTWLTVEYRRPGEGFAPYHVILRTAQLLIPLPGGPEEETREGLQARTEAAIRNWTWYGGGQGVRIEVSTADGERLWSGYTTGFGSRAHLDAEESKALGAEPWFFDLSLSLAADRAAGAPLLAAIARGDVIRVHVASPDGMMLTDYLRTDGSAQAMEDAENALADPAIALPLPERCLPLVGSPPARWTEKQASPAMRTCDARTPEQRRAVPGYAPR
jgi:hypothetical protein